MKNNYGYKRKKYCFVWFCFWCMAMVGTTSAQITNKGTTFVKANTENGVFFNYTNTAVGTYTNNGLVYVHKNWENNGTIGYTPGQTGSTQFLGTAQQSITGTGNSTYYNILFNNTAPTGPEVLLKKEISIFGNADFTKGIVQESSDGLIVFQDNAAHTNVSHASFVDGTVRKVGNQAFVFPIGDGNGTDFMYRMAAISAPANITDAFDATYIWQNSNTINAHTSKEIDIEIIDDTEYWTIERIKGNAMVDITLSWDPATTPASIIAAATNNELIIVRWNGTEWINEGGTAITVTTTITTTPTGYGMFTLAVATMDTDGDGVTDTQEVVDATDPEDNCDFLTASVTLTQSTAFLEADCDEDGIANGDEGPTEGEDPLDTDGDGIPDYLDTDDDGDGIATSDEDIDGDGDPTNDDSDGDGIPDYLDPDDDGDGIATADEDIDGDGDPTNDDSDGDGIPDYLDPDDDGDGIATADEDIDGDGDATNDDSDGDGIPDYLDPDDDGDGIATADEDTDGDGDSTNDDTDGDGVPNYLDPDNTVLALHVSNAFTPNGDGINDLFVVKDLEVLYPNFEMTIVNRYGNIVYVYKHGGNPNKSPIWWDGSSNGRMNLGSGILPAGTYFYVIYFNDASRENQAGWIYLRR